MTLSSHKLFARVATGLCAGIAGFELPLHRLGWQPGMVAEIDPAAPAVLAARLPNAPLTGDVRELADLPRQCSLVCCGFPCQDISVAGMKADGIEGERSRIVKEVFRLLERRRVDTVIVENVPFILRLKDGTGIQAVTSGFSSLGYRWAYRVVDALTFGLPQRRQRIVLVASLSRDPRDVLLADDAGIRPKVRAGEVDYRAGGMGFYWTEGLRGVGTAPRAIPPLKAGSTIGIPSAPAVLTPDGFVGTPAIEDTERLQGFDAGHTEPALAVERGSRWRLVGNALPTPIAEWLGRRLLEPGCYDAGRDVPLAEARSWPTAAWDMGEGIHGSSASDNPLGLAAPDIADFLSRPLRPLSVRATQGFLSRAGRSTLTFPPGMLAALQRHVDRLSGWDDLPLARAAA